jgi:molecular chaperone DnaK
VNRVRTSVADLESTMQRVGQEVYNQAGATSGPNGYSNPGAGATGTEQGNDGGTVEGEYREV